MNYIKRLEAELELQKEAAAKMTANIDSFIVFLHSSKFTGTDNGERKDWIATGDLIGWLRQLRTEITV